MFSLAKISAALPALNIFGDDDTSMGGGEGDEETPDPFEDAHDDAPPDRFEDDFDDDFLDLEAGEAPPSQASRTDAPPVDAPPVQAPPAEAQASLTQAQAPPTQAQLPLGAAARAEFDRRRAEIDGVGVACNLAMLGLPTARVDAAVARVDEVMEQEQPPSPRVDEAMEERPLSPRVDAPEGSPAATGSPATSGEGSPVAD